MDETAADSEEASEVVEETPAEETTEETADKVVEEDSEESDEAAKEAVVEEAPVEEDLIEEIVEGEADDTSLQAMPADITVQFAEDVQYITWDDENAETTTANTDYTFKLNPEKGYRIADDAVTAKDSTTTTVVGLAVTKVEDEDNTWTIASDDITDNLTSPIIISATATATRDITVTWDGDKIESVTYDSQTSTDGTTGLAFTIDDNTADAKFTVKVKDTYKETYKPTTQGTDVTAPTDVDTTGGSYEYTVTSGTDDLSIAFTTEKITYKVTKPSDTNITFIGAETANAKEEYTFTATANEGYRVTKVEYTVGSGNAQELYVVQDGSYSISAENVTGDITITVTTAQLFDVTVSKEQDAEIASIKYAYIDAAGDDYPAYETAREDAFQVAENGKVKLQITANKGYKPTVSYGSNQTVTVTQDKTDKNLYTTEEITISEETAITVSTEAKDTYNITEAIDTDDTAESAPMAEITYDADCTTGTAGTDLKTVADTDLVFTVAPSDAKYYVQKVSYQVTGGSETPLEADAGKYTIPAEKLTDAVTITVKAVTIAESAAVTFTDSSNKTKVTDKAGKVITSPDTVGAAGMAKPYEFKVVLDEEVEDASDYKITSVTVAQGASESPSDNPVPLTPDKDGVYSFRPVQAYVTVTITTVEKDDVKVTFTVDEESAGTYTSLKPTELTVNGKPNTTDLSAASGELTVKEGDKVTFKVTKNEAPNNKYKVKSVTATPEAGEAAELTPANDVYTVTAGTGTDAKAIAVKITSELDEATCNVLNFETDGLKTSYTKTVAGEEYTEDKYLTADSSAEVVITPEVGYKITKVLLGTEEQTKDAGDGVNTYTVNVTFAADTRVQTIKVITEPEDNDAVKTVTFTDRFYQLSYKVAVKDGEVTADGKGTYKVSKAAKYFAFTVTTPDAKKYKLKEADDLKNAGYDVSTSEDGKSTTYTIAANKLQPNESIELTEQIATVTVTVTYDADNVTAELRAGNKTGTEGVLVPDTTTYAVTPDDYSNVQYGTPLNLTVTPYNIRNYKITAATVETPNEDAAADAPDADKTTKKDITVAANGFTYSFVPTTDTTIVVTSDGVYNVTDLTAADATTVKANADGSYTVDAGTAYKADVTKGGTEDINITNAAVTDAKGKPVSADTKAEAKDGAVTLTVAAADAGKTLKVAMIEEVKVPGTPATDDKEEVPESTKEETRATYTINVRNPFTKVAVAGVSKDGKLAQTIDTNRLYKLTITPKTAKAADLGVKVEPEAVAAAAIENGMLSITTNPDTASKTAKITIFDKADKEQKAIDGGAIELTTEVPVIKDGEITVTQKSATSTGVRLLFAAPKNAAAPFAGTLGYEYVITPKAAVEGKDIPKNLPTTTKAEGTVWVAAGALNAESELIKVFPDGVKDKDGAAWEFDVKVKLVQKLGDSTTATAFTSAESVTTAATKDPSFEYKLSMKKGQTTVYTGQNGVTIATAGFGKDTSYIEDIQAEVIAFKPGNKYVSYYYSQDLDKLDGILEFNTDRLGKDAALTINTVLEDPDDYSITYAPAGTYTVEVTAFAPDTMYETKTTYKFTVVNGINDIYLMGANGTDTGSLYKPANKPATAKLTPEYNFGDLSRAPKSKKVTWEIYDSEANLIDKNHTLGKLITVKNGTVSVNKAYEPKNFAGDDFTVVAHAADFKGNEETIGTYGLTVTAQAAELGKAVLLTQEGGNFNVMPEGTAKAPINVSVDEANNLVVAVLRTDAPQKQTYTADELGRWAVDTDMLTAKTSNKQVGINTWASSSFFMLTTSSLTKPAKNLTLTMTAADGSKTSRTLKYINIGYAEVEALGINVVRLDYEDRENMDRVDELGLLSPAGEKNISYYGTKDTEFKFEVLAKNADQWDTLPALTNYKVSVSGGKLLPRDTYWDGMNMGPDDYRIVPTAAVTKITVNDITNKVKTDYVLSNQNTSKAAGPSMKTTDKLLAGSNGPQTVTYTLTGRYDTAGKSVLVSTDAAARLAKNGSVVYGYSDLERQSNVNRILDVKNGKVELKFNNGSDRTYLTAGSYKLSFTYGKVENGNFVADAKPVSVTLKVQQLPNASFKLNTKYNLTKDSGYKALLGGTSKGRVGVSFKTTAAETEGGKTPARADYALYNANIKGQENHFRDLFKVEAKYNAEGNFDGYYLALQDLNETTRAYLTDANNLKGYVHYSVQTEGGGKTSYEPSVVTAITVTLDKGAVKYTATSPSVYKAAAGDTVTTATVKAGSNPAQLAYAYAEGEGAFTAEAVLDNGSPTDTVKLTTKAAAGSYKLTLYLIPADSYYKAEVAKVANDAAKYAEAMKLYGATATTTVKVLDKTDAKVLTLPKNAKAAFVADNYDQDTKTYAAKVSFTQKVDDKIAAVTAKETDEKQKDLTSKLTVNAVQNAGKGFVTATVAQDALNALIKTGEAAYTPYGQSVAAELTFTFVSGATQTETVTFTMPQTPQTFEEAAKAADAAAYDKSVITGEEIADCLAALKEAAPEDEADNITYENAVEEIITARIKSAIEAQFANGAIKLDSNLKLSDITWEELSRKEDTKAATTTADVRIKMPNSNDNASLSDQTFTWQNEAADAEPMTPAKALEVFEALDLTIETNAYATYTYVFNEIMKAFAEENNAPLPSHLRLSIRSFTKKAATAKADGSVTGSYVVTDIRYGNETVVSEDGFTYTITQLQTLNAAESALQAKVNADQNPFTNRTSKEDTLAFIKSVLSNPDITVTWAQADDPQDSTKKVDDWFFTDQNKATKQAEGTIECGVVLANPLESDETVTVNLDFKVAMLRASDAVKSAITTALSQVNLAKLVKDNTADTLKDAVLEAAKAAIAKDDFVVDYIADTETKKGFVYEEMTYAKDGSLTVNLELFTKKEDGTKGDSQGPVTEITYTITKEAALMTLEDAAADIKKALEEGDSAFGKTVSNTTKETEIVSAADNAVESDSGISVTAKEGTFVLTPATYAADGKITGTLTLTKCDADDNEIATAEYAYSFDIKKLDPLTTPVADTVKAAVGAVTVRDTEVADADALKAVNDNLLAVAKAAANGSGYTIETKTAMEKPSTTPAVGTPTDATIIFNVKAPTEGAQVSELTCTVKVYKTQTAAEAKTAADTAVKALNLTAVADDKGAAKTLATQIKEAVTATTVLSELDYTASVSVDSYTAPGAEAGSISGKVYIYTKAENARVLTHATVVEFKLVVKAEQAGTP